MEGQLEQLRTKLTAARQGKHFIAYVTFDGNTVLVFINLLWTETLNTCKNAFDRAAPSPTSNLLFGWNVCGNVVRIHYTYRFEIVSL